MRSLICVLAMACVGIFSHAEEIKNIEVFAKMDKYPADGYSAIWGYTAPNGREYALLGVQTGTSIVDITENPVKEVAFIPGLKTMWRELKTYKHYAYVVTDNANSGIQIIDLSQLPSTASLASTFADLPMSHTLWTDEATETLFTMGGTGHNVVVFDIHDPLNPVELSRFGSTYVHDAYFRNGRAYLAEIMSKSFSIWDISNRQSPRLIKRIRDPQAPSISFHNSWLTEDSNYLLTTEETTGRTLKIWDVRDTNNIRLVSEYLSPNGMVHNVQIKGRFAHLSCYGGGIRVLDLADPTKPVEVAAWSKGSGRERGFVSIWGAYPFFASGKVIGSDMESGLVVLKFNEGLK